MNLHNLESVFTLTWQSSWRACLLIVVVLMAQTLGGKRLPARFRYALSLMVLLRLIVPGAPASRWSVFNLTRHFADVPAVAPILPSAVAPAMVAPSPLRSPLATSRPSRVPLGEWAAVCWLCGGAGFLLAVLLRQRKFARWVAQLPASADPRVGELVEQCKVEAGLRRPVEISIVPRGNSPAVFGFFCPRLLLPEGLLDTLERREARLVLLHEFLHIRRRDVLVNWISVLALALHWFNPLAWVAMRRLRADQELACDAAVLGLIEQSERGAYGRTLLKYTQNFPPIRMAAGLVPLITSRHNIKRRIIMITEFKSTGGLARGLFALLFVALGGLTFTRAAEDPSPAATTTGPTPAAATDPFLETPGVTPPPRAGQDYGAEYMKQSTLLGELKKMDREDHSRFIQALSVTVSDPILNSLLSQELAQETRVSSLNRSAPHSQQLREEITVMGELKQKIDERANGIIAGMSLQVEALKAAANDGLHRGHTPDNTLSQRLEDWDHQRVMAEADFLEYSNILAHLQLLKSDQLGGALSTAYAHQTDPELNELAATLRIAKERWMEVKQTYGPRMDVYKTAQKEVEVGQIAYDDKIKAIMAGLETRVNEDKGLIQLYEEQEKLLEEMLRKQQEGHPF